MKTFILNFLNGFLTTLITFIILQALIYFSIELPYLPLNLEKMAIFLCVLALLSYVILKVRKISSFVFTIAGGVVASFLIFNYSLLITDIFVNTLIGGIIVGIISTVSKFI